MARPRRIRTLFVGAAVLSGLIALGADAARAEGSDDHPYVCVYLQPWGFDLNYCQPIPDVDPPPPPR